MDILNFKDFLAMHGGYSNDIYGDYQDYIEKRQKEILGESQASKSFRYGK